VQSADAGGASVMAAVTVRIPRYAPERFLPNKMRA
jgi:hypothetical protein